MIAARDPDPFYEYDEDRVVYLSHDEVLAMLDKQAREYLSMSGEDFLRRWETGDFEDPDSFEVFHVGILAPMLLTDR